MKTIYKYGPLTSRNSVLVQGRIVHAEYRDVGYFTAEQGIYIWSEVSDAEADRQLYKVAVVGTGDKYDGLYHKTVVMPDGLVWHVIEEER